MITPCGVVPKTNEVVRNTVEYAAEVISGFEGARFKTRLDQAFYELEEVSAYQLLYVGLQTVVHIWNRTLASRLEIQPFNIQKISLFGFLLTFYKPNKNILMLHKRIGVYADTSKEADGNETENPGREKNEIDGETPMIRVADDMVAENPFGVAHDIVKTLVAEDWEAYATIPNNTLQPVITKKRKKETHPVEPKAQGVVGYGEGG